MAENRLKRGMFGALRFAAGFAPAMAALFLAFAVFVEDRFLLLSVPLILPGVFERD